MPASESSSKPLHSQLKQLRWAIAPCEHAPNVLQVLGAEPKLVLPIFFFLVL